MATVNRRTFLGASASAALTSAAPADSPIPIIDTHIHLYDPTRPQGVPWPPKGGKVPYQPMLPDTFRKVTKPFGVVGAIEVECSPWLEDNQWVLDVIAKDTIMLGTVGDLEPGKPDFRKHLDRFHKDKHFLGIRFAYLWGRDLAAEIAKPQCIADLKAMADAGLEMDTFGGPALLADVLRITDQVPNLRVVIDHLANQEVPKEPAARAKYEGQLRELGKRPQVYVKISEVLQHVGDRVPYELSYYRPKLDHYWEIFGPDRLIYGSDWPNGETVGTYAQVFGLVREYFMAKGHEAAEKFFWKNSVAAYRWSKREAGQPGR